MPTTTPEKYKISAVKTLEFTEMELSNMYSELLALCDSEKKARCIQNMEAYFMADNHENFWSSNHNLISEIIQKISEFKSNKVSKSELLSVLERALNKVRYDIKMKMAK